MTPISPADIEAKITERGGFTAATFALWGVPFPPPKGWKATIIEFGIPYCHDQNRHFDAAVRRAAKKQARKDRKQARKAASSVEVYRKKHLTMVTKDGASLFGNVKQHAVKSDREAFYRSWEWRRLRMQVIKGNARRCMCCGSTPDDVTIDGQPVRLVVDHIKPISKYWHLRLVASNLQILCDECNMGKGAWDETDHRSESERLIAQQLTYVVDGDVRSGSAA